MLSDIQGWGWARRAIRLTLVAPRGRLWRNEGSVGGVAPSHVTVDESEERCQCPRIRRQLGLRRYEIVALTGVNRIVLWANINEL